MDRIGIDQQTEKETQTCIQADRRGVMQRIRGTEIKERTKTGSLNNEPKNRFNTVEFALFYTDKGIASLTPPPTTFSVVMAILQMTQEQR